MMPWIHPAKIFDLLVLHIPVLSYLSCILIKDKIPVLGLDIVERQVQLTFRTPKKSSYNKQRLLSSAQTQTTSKLHTKYSGYLRIILYRYIGFKYLGMILAQIATTCESSLIGFRQKHLQKDINTVYSTTSHNFSFLILNLMRYIFFREI